MATVRLFWVLLIGFGGVAEAVCKMAFGNEIGVEIVFTETDNYDKTAFENDLFGISYGSVLVESVAQLSSDKAICLGQTVEDKSVRIIGNLIGESHKTLALCSLDELYKANTEKFAEIYPIKK